MKAARTILVLLLGLVVISTASAIDVDVTAPGIDLRNELETLDANVLDGAIEDELNRQLSTLATDLETELEEQELDQFTDLPKLSQGFANAGSTAAHLGTQRAFSDYDLFAVVVGSGLGLSTPGVDATALESAASDIEDEGDIYLGAAVQPITVSFGLNLERWVPRTRADIKVGFANLDQGTLTDELSFNSLSFGAGIRYQLVESWKAPVGFVVWRGLSVGSGFMFQRNETNIEIDVAGEDGFTTDPITFGDIGLTDAELAAAGITDITAGDEIGNLKASPVLEAGIESRTFSIPLEASTGVRLLWVLELNAGLGVDVVFGNSELSVGATSDAVLDVTDQAERYIETTPGRASVSSSTSNGPQFLRPRLTGGLGLNLGPVKLDFPLMMYFDTEGNSIMAGVNLGIVW